MNEYWGKIIKCDDMKCNGCLYSKHEYVKCDLDKSSARQFDEVIIGTSHLIKIKPKQLNKQL